MDPRTIGKYFIVRKLLFFSIGVLGDPPVRYIIIKIIIPVYICSVSYDDIP